MKPILTIALFFLLNFPLFAQETTTTEEVQDTFKTPQYEVVYDDLFLSKKETKWLVKVDFLPYIEELNNIRLNRRLASIEFERKIGRILSINSGLNWNDDSPLRFSASIEPRLYINQKKGVQNLNGIYLSCMAEYGRTFEERPVLFNHLGLGVGLQKRIANNWYFNYSLGYVDVGFMYKKSRIRSDFFINNQVTFGFAIGGGKKSKIEMCEVFRCFEEERNLFKIDIRGLFERITKNGFSSRFTLANETKLGKSVWSINNELRAQISSSFKGIGYSYRFLFISEPRYYLNLKKRIAQGKSANNLSGIYMGLGFGAGIYKDKTRLGDLSTNNLLNQDKESLMLFSSFKLGLQKKVFKNGFFDISLTPVEFFFRNKKEREIRSIGGGRIDENVINKPLRFDHAIGEILNFFDFKIGFAF